MKKRVFVLVAVLMLAAALLSLSAFAADNVRYVANAAMGTGDGLTAENATTLDKAFTELNTNVFTKAEHAGETCTIYLVEDITLMQYRPEGKTSPRTTQVFSEDAHADNAVAILTMPGKAKATITFPYGSTSATRVYNYLLSGETSFDNVIFTTGVKGSIQIPVIAAHGHKLTLGAGVETVKADGCHGVAVAGITFSTNTFRTKQGEKAATVFTPDVTVLGGEYEYIAAFSYNAVVAAGSSSKLTLGNVKVGTLTATNHTGGTVGKDVAVDVIYTGKVEAEKFWPTRRPLDRDGKNGGTFSHTLQKGATLSYTEMNVDTAGESTLNILFDPTDAAVAKQAKALYDALHDDANIGTFTFSTVTTEPVCADDAHVKVTAKLTEATCAEGAMEYDYCSVCGKMLSEIRKGEPDATKHNTKDAAWVLNDTSDAYIKKCANCGKEAAIYPVTDGKVAVYVSANGNANGGESKENPVDTLRGAQNLAAKLAETYYGADDSETPVTIYVIGRVDMPSRIYDASGALMGNKVSDGNLNKFTQCFEETPHVDHPFVFTSLDGAERGLLNFLVIDAAPATATRNMTYMLYGPTTFENISFGAAGGTYEGVEYLPRSGHTMIGRGFKFVLGEGITMVDNKEKISNNTNRTVLVSDIKLYVSGGFYASGDTHANCAVRKDTDSYDADFTVLSGEYWFVGTLNRAVTAVSNTTGTLTLGSPTVMYLDPISTGKSALKSVLTNVHYTGAAKVKYLYLGMPESDAGSDKGGYNDGGYTANHLFFPGSSGMTVVAIYATYRDEVNFYYYGSDSAKANEIAGTRYINKIDTMAEYCIDWRGGHTAGADGNCIFCGVKPCTGEHDYSSFAYVTEATCTAEATGYYYCTNCHDRLELIKVGEINPDNHDFQPVGDHLVCSRCQKTLQATEPVVYVTNVAFTGVSNGLSARTPLKSYNDAYMLAVTAAQAAGASEATIYLVGGATIPIDFYEGTYLEPEHADIEVTVKGYGSDSAALIFGDSVVQKIEYGLNGPVIFDNVDIGSAGTNQMYFSARHYHLTMGKQVSMDFRRNIGGGDAHSGAVTVLGGCFSTNFGTCDGMDTHLTLYAGTYRNIIGGSAGGRACGLVSGKCTVEILGDVVTREAIFGGSSGVDAGDIDFIVDGNASADQWLTFGSSGNNTAGHVRVFLRSGSLASSSFADSGRMNIYPIGSANTTAAIDANKASIVFYYDPSVPSSREMMRMIRTTAIGGDRVTFELLDSLCTASANGKHTHAAGAAPVETSEKTCFTDGYEIYECTACHKEYTVSTGKAEHTFGSATSIAPTCKDYGMTAKTCEICGYTQYTVDSNAAPNKDGHDPQNKNNTLDKNGVCTICHYSAAADCAHEWKTDYETEQSKCGTTVYKVCAKCNLHEIVSTTGNHNWGVYTVTVEPTDTTPGTKTRKCKTCGKIETALLYPNDASIATDPIAVDASGNAVGFTVENAKLTKAEKAALNALLQDTAYGSEIKVSYTTDGTTVTNVTYSIPVPDEYKDYENVKVVIKDDAGTLHTVDFKIEKGYIVFTF